MPYVRRYTARRTFGKRVNKSYGRRARPAARRTRYAGARRRWIRKAPQMGVPSGLPLTRRANLRWAYQGELHITTSETSGYGYLDLNASSVFDPSNGASISQPMGFDQWASLFNSYLVTGSKLTAYVTYRNQSAATNLPVICGCYLADDATIPYVTWLGLVEAKRGTYRNLTAQQERPCKINSYYSARKFNNIKDPKDNLATLGALVTASPTKNPKYIIWADVVGTPRVEMYMTCTVIIDFCVEFMEPKDIARS